MTSTGRRAATRVVGKRVAWSIAALVLLIIAFGFAVPHLAADRFGAAAQKALETSLGRKVTIEGVQYNLFTGPGFTINKVIIFDDPALSPEPILYADTLTAIPRIWPLFTGHLAFSSIKLVDAHINLGRTAEPDKPARWNVEPLIRPALFRTFPNIQVESGGVTFLPKSRLNFKIGGVKTVFYVLIDRLDVRPPSSGDGQWAIHLEGEPARSDRPALGFGSFIADGHWNASQGLADINVKLERSEVGDIIALLNGYDAGVHGMASGSVRIAGPLAALKINGRVDVSGIHGWDQLASSAQSWPLAIAGTWNLPAQLFELNARMAGQTDSPLNARFRVADYLGVPHWGITPTCHAMPLQPLLPLARQIGLAIPAGTQLNGILDGAVSVSRTGPPEGSGQASHVSLTASGAAPLQFEDMQLMIGGGHARLEPVTFHTTTGEEATLESDYDLAEHSLDFTVTSHGMDIAAMRRHAELAGIPALRDLQSGVWKGEVTYTFAGSNSGPDQSGWSGALDIARASMNLPMFASPVRIASAHVELDGASLAAHKIQARSGDLAVTGDYSYEAAAPRPHHFHLVTTRVTGAQLEALFRPALQRGGLVSRTLGLRGSEVPPWLTQMKADGSIETASLHLGGAVFEHVSARAIEDGAHIKLAGLKARYNGGSLSGIIDADFSGAAPAYRLAGDAAGIPWKGGKVDGDFSADTSGIGSETMVNLRGDGSFRSHGLEFDYTSLAGCFQFGWSRNIPQLKLTSVKAGDGNDTWIGNGAMSPQGDLVLNLEGVATPVRLSLR